MQAGDCIGYLWTPHNKHRLVFTRILIAFDIRFLNGEGTAFALLDAFLLAAMVATSWSKLVATVGRGAFAVFACSAALILLTPDRDRAVAGMAYLRANHIGWALIPIGSADQHEREAAED